MRIYSTLTILITLIFSLFIFCTQAFADAPLESKIDNLTMEQKRQIKEIQKQARDAIRPVRGNLHREVRKLRRAEYANDAATIAEQQKLIEPLEDQFRAIFTKEEANIRNLLNPEQEKQFDRWLAERNAMVGSSRDVKVIED